MRKDQRTMRFIERIVVDRNAGEIRLYEAPSRDYTPDDGVAPAPVVLPFSFVENGSVVVTVGSATDTVAMTFLAIDGVEIVPSAVPE